MSDATGRTKYSIVGAVAYIRFEYHDKTFGWLLVAACSKLADDGLTIVAKELKGAQLATVLAKRVSRNLHISTEKVFFYVDNTIILDQIEACRDKGIGHLTRGIGKTNFYYEGLWQYGRAEAYPVGLRAVELL